MKNETKNQVQDKINTSSTEPEKETWEDQVYNILFEKSTVDGVRVIHEDKWPTKELVKLVKKAVQEREEEIVKLIEFYKTTVSDSFCNDYSDNLLFKATLSNIIQKIQKGEQKG